MLVVFTHIAISVLFLLAYGLLSHPLPVRQPLRAHKDLRRYARLATIPDMRFGEPLSTDTDDTDTDETSAEPENHLKIMHETYRKLRHMHSLEHFSQCATLCTPSIRFPIFSYCSPWRLVNTQYTPSEPRGESDEDRSIGGAIRMPAIGYDIRLNHGKPTHLDE